MRAKIESYCSFRVNRGLLGADDRTILEYAFNDDRILVIANVGDFERSCHRISRMRANFRRLKPQDNPIFPNPGFD